MIDGKSAVLLPLTRRGRNTKIHAVVDALGNPVKLHLTPGNVNDCVGAVEGLSGITLSGSVVLGGNAYGTAEIRNYIESNGASYCIPPQIQYNRTLGMRFSSLQGEARC